MQKKEQSFEEQLFIAQQQIVNQFDPQHPDYHKGDTRPVPTGGQRLPESMPYAYPAETKMEEPFEEVKIEETNPQKQLIIQQREKLAELKKTLERIGPLIETKFRYIIRLQTSKKQSNIEKANELIKQENFKIISAIESIAAQMQANSNDEKFQKFAQEIGEVSGIATTDFQTKEEVTDFGFRMKRLTEAIFREMKDLLQQAKNFK